MATPIKQNKGAETKSGKSDIHKTGGKAASPRAGSSAVEIEGTVVKAKKIEGVTVASSENKGSHDGKVRMHADDSE